MERKRSSRVGSYSVTSVSVLIVEYCGVPVGAAAYSGVTCGPPVCITREQLQRFNILFIYTLTLIPALFEKGKNARKTRSSLFYKLLEP